MIGHIGEQRKLERDIRYAQRKAAMLDATGDTEGFDAEALKIKNAQAKYNAFCKQTGAPKGLIGREYTSIIII